MLPALTIFLLTILLQAGVDGADEIWAYGLRNAWKFSFDLTTGNAMIADVGQGAIEEINKMPITQAGLNYGWRCYEGNNAYNTAGCPAQSTMTFPVAVYDHSGGNVPSPEAMSTEVLNIRLSGKIFLCRLLLYPDRNSG
jgi:glucose/arabinose dehydrogenase